MPRSREGVKRPPVITDNLKQAVNDVIAKRFSITKAAKNCSISKTTLLRHLKLHRESNEDIFSYRSNIKSQQVFTDQEEQMLEKYLLTASQLHYGLSKKELAVLAFQFAIENKKKMPPKWAEKKRAGKEWVRCFLQRHKILRLRKPEATSLARATSFNKTNVSQFFSNLKIVLDRFRFSPSSIYNLDETGNSTVHVPPKILAQKGQKQIGTLTSGERGLNITMIAAVNALGNHIPPMLIFPRVHFKDHMLKGAPPGSIGGANPSGWSTETLFVDYINHFIAHTNPTNERKILLILDNHETHISIPAINLCKANGIVLLTLPPHCSHKLQPLDRTVFGPYKTYYNQASSEWMTNNPGKPVSIYDVAEIIGKAYPKAFTIENIVKGFEVTGICPFNENIFGDHEFLAAYVTDRPENDILNKKAEENIANSTDGEESRVSVESQIVSPEQIRPFPKAPPRKTGPNRRRKAKTRILTDTPEKEEIEQSRSKVKIKPEPKVVKIVKKKIYTESSSSDGEEDNDVVLTELSSGNEEEFFEQLRNEQEEQDSLPRNRPLAKGDFLLVKVSGEKSFSHFVAEISELCDKGFIVRFYSKITGTTAARNFIPSDEVPSFVDSEDVVLELPPPTKVGTSKRQENQICFNVDFSMFKMM